METKQVLAIKNISKRVGKKTIVKDATFTINKGKVTGLLGPKGANS